MLKVIPIYAALRAFFYVYLSARTIGVRRKAKISIGDGGDDEMLRAMRMSLSGILCLRHSMSKRSIYANESKDRGGGHSGIAAHFV